MARRIMYGFTCLFLTDVFISFLIYTASQVGDPLPLTFAKAVGISSIVIALTITIFGVVIGAIICFIEAFNLTPRG